MPSDLEPRLRGLYRQPIDGQAAHQQALEPELLALVARQRDGAAVARRRGGAGAGAPGRRGWLGLPRLALAGVLGVAVAVGACVLPAEYPVSLGYGFELVLPADRAAALDPQALAARLEGHPGVERIELRVHQRQSERIGDDGARTVQEDTRLQLFVFGDAVDAHALRAELQASFPALAELELHDVPLAGTVHGTFGGALSHRLLHVTIDTHGVAEAERQVLAALVAEGLAPEHLEVDITEARGADGERRIEVRVQAEHDETTPEPPSP